MKIDGVGQFGTETRETVTTPSYPHNGEYSRKSTGNCHRVWRLLALIGVTALLWRSRNTVAVVIKNDYGSQQRLKQESNWARQMDEMVTVSMTAETVRGKLCRWQWEHERQRECWQPPWWFASHGGGGGTLRQRGFRMGRGDQQTRYTVSK